jgi:hypothetical protein
MEAICSSETLVATQQTTRRHIPEDDTLPVLMFFKLIQYLKFKIYDVSFGMDFHFNVASLHISIDMTDHKSELKLGCKNSSQFYTCIKCGSNMLIGLKILF